VSQVSYEGFYDKICKEEEEGKEEEKELERNQACSLCWFRR
jgi:hypothetical protein